MKKKGGAKPAGWTQEKRRATGGNVVASFSLPVPVNLLVDVLAKRLEVSRSEVVRRALNLLWQEMPDDDELARRAHAGDVPRR